MNRSLSLSRRRLVLASALLAATLVALLPETQAVRAATSHLPLPLVVAQSTAESAAQSAREAAREAGDAAREAAREAHRGANVDIDLGDVDKDGRRKGIRIGVDGVDRQYDSFDQFLDRDPALASMVLGIVFIVFLTPILIIALIVWYKMRKNKMQNETMLRLAEKGVIPAADAMQAIGAGQVGPMLGVAAANVPLAEQARTLLRQAAWSDLRKGVLMGGIGLALTLYSIVEDGSPGWVGLVLLFVGIGYVVLWYFEEQRAVVVAPERAATPAPRPGPGDATN